MSVYAAYAHGTGKNTNRPHKELIQGVHSYAGCFGLFQHTLQPSWTEESVKYSMLMKSRNEGALHNNRIAEQTLAFMQGKFFNRLTGGQVLAVAPAAPHFNGENIRAKMGHFSHGDEENMLEVTFNPHYSADRLITAFRMATQHWKFGDDRQMMAMPEHLWEFIPLAVALQNGNGLSYSDGYITFNRITAEQAREYAEDHHNRDWDDVYYDDFIDNIHTNTRITTGGVIELINRTEAEFAAFERGLNKSLYLDGYTKDDELSDHDLSELADGDLLSISAPVSLDNTDGDTLPRTIQEIAQLLHDNQK